MKKLFLFTFCLLGALFSNMLQAQTQTITGTVVQDSGSAPIPGASVRIKNTSKGVVTDANGQFSIQAAIGDVIVISATNFSNKEVKISRGGGTK